MGNATESCGTGAGVKAGVGECHVISASLVRCVIPAIVMAACLCRQAMGQDTQACCFPFQASACQNLSAASCQASPNFGTPQGEGVFCSDGECGACCDANDECADRFEQLCTADGGRWLRDFACDFFERQVCLVEACCLPSGACLDRVPQECDEIGGISQGPTVLCRDLTCPPPPPEQACCFDDGGCAVLLPDECSTNGGLSQGPGSD